jgi:hypothetical protein
MKKLLIILCISICGIDLSFAQGELDEQQKVFFRNERSFAILLNSDGFALGYRRGNRIDYLNKRLIEIDIGTLKHPKEVKLSNSYYQTNGSFVFGKLNSVFFIRGGLGHQHEIFRKADLGGIAVRYFYSAGPVLALYKPIYYKVLYPVGMNTYQIKEEKFESSIHHPGDIYARSSFTKGLNEMQALPGLYAKAGFNFEYSKQDKIIHAIEIGSQINAFPKKIPIMATTDNKAIFFSLFVSYRFGVVLNPLDPEGSKISKIFSRNPVK